MVHRSLFDIDFVAENEDIKDYEFTIAVILAMDNLMSYNFQGHSSHGRTMTTSANNQIHPTTDVTPDMVIEVYPPEGLGEYSAIGEVKSQLPKDQEQWFSYAQQLKKYDDDLKGWNNHYSATHDLLFTTNPLRTRDFSEYMSLLQKSGTIVLTRKLCIVDSSSMDQAKSFVLFKKESGSLSNATLDNMLTGGKAIDRNHIVRQLSQMKFCDHHPPTLYTMAVIWDFLIKTFISLEQRRRLIGNTVLRVQVTIWEIHRRLSHFAPNGNGASIKPSWIQDALEGFVEVEIARKLPGQGLYEFKLRSHDGEFINWISSLVSQIRSERESRTTSLDDFVHS